MAVFEAEPRLPGIRAVFIEKRKFGGRAIYLSGHVYQFNRTSGVNKCRWLCRRQRWHKCRAVLYTVDDHIVKIIDDHNHPPEIINNL
ncbi:hypothetical protein JYU34_004388 [Plutella xylostella]|uniref:FLYWCH-type domain-containing protein n=1 Tax=Plutella xylostella TaxID=51655 RepID=A0ABQ7QXV3_PLUXY|nr:hypothetical protein JYU34_004388 [Plutella xylostella]